MDDMQSIDVKAFLEDGKQFYVESHWQALKGIPYAGDTDNDGDTVDGIMISDDKEKLDSITVYDDGSIENGIVLTSPNGFKFLLTVTDDGKLDTVPYLYQ